MFHRHWDSGAHAEENGNSLAQPFRFLGWRQRIQAQKMFQLNIEDTERLVEIRSLVVLERRNQTETHLDYLHCAAKTSKFMNFLATFILILLARSLCKMMRTRLAVVHVKIEFLQNSYRCQVTVRLMLVMAWCQWCCQRKVRRDVK